MRAIAGVLLSALLGIGLGVGATFAIVSTNAPDKTVEATFNSKNAKERYVVPYGQR